MVFMNIEHIRDCVRYDSEAGILYWKNRPESHFKNAGICNWWNSRYSGKKIGYMRKDGYLEFAIDNKLYLVHRVIWAVVTGLVPDQVDHIDHNRSNNTWRNLRVVSPAQNRMNMKLHSDNTSGIMGVSWSKISQKWHSYITVNKKRINLGFFDDINDAKTERMKAERLHGFHENHGERV